MSGEIGPIQRPATISPAVLGTGRAEAVAQAAPPARPAAVDTVELGVPAAPPSDVLAQVAAAAARAGELAAANRELHFSRDEDSGRIVVQVRDLEGRVIRTIPPSRALEVMSGSQGWE